MRDDDDSEHGRTALDTSALLKYWDAIKTEDGKVLCVESKQFRGFYISYHRELGSSWVPGIDTLPFDKQVKLYFRGDELQLKAVNRLEPVPPPGLAFVERVLRWVMPGKTYKRVLAETIADFKQEHAEAYSAGQPLRARWFVVLGYLAIIRALAAQLLSIVELIRKLSS